MPGFTKLFEDERPGKRLKTYSQQQHDAKEMNAARTGHISKAWLRAARKRISPLKGKQGLMALTG